MLLLSTAADLYWLGRYLKRSRTLLSVLLKAFAQPNREQLIIPLSLTATGAYYYQQYPEVKDHFIADFFSDGQNASSITACLVAIRADAQATRGSLPSQLWLAINKLYLTWQASFVSKIDYPVLLAKYQSLDPELAQIQQLIDDLSSDIALFINLGQSIEALDNLLRQAFIKQGMPLDQQQAQQILLDLEGYLQNLSAPIWHKVIEPMQKLRQAMTEQMPVVALQQHLQQLTAAITDVFAS
ncbi:alpha-E domain-containing protein [uncultured Agitococcus sp.]|uniref:alpha-E domain-containing protein n=1 Tax=uncultured Agitococcus sp. TaxID=1506599 RepID=UPI0026364451|nr:alpha-E domain-containing protein [uncultured Agitococcus sp.]